MKKTILAAAALLLTVSVLFGCAPKEPTQTDEQEPESSSTFSGSNVTASMPDDDTAAPTASENNDETASPSPSLSPSPSPSDSAEPEPEPSDSEMPAPNYSDVIVEADIFTYNSDYIDVSIETPRVEGLDDAAVQDGINAVFSDYAQYAQSDIDTYEQENKEFIEQGYNMGAPYAIDITFEVMYLDNGLLSMTLADYRYTGGAHGGTILLAFTFDLSTGDQLNLPDMMTDDRYKEFVNAVIREEIDRLVSEGELYELAPFEDIGNTSQWYLTEGAIVFYFQQYEYFPYAAGIQEFAVTYDQLQTFMNDRYMSHFFNFGSP